MEKGILLDLKSIKILSELNVIRLKQYILKKYPGDDNNRQSLVFADAVKRIVNGKLPECDAHAKEKLKSHVLRNALKKRTFSVDCSDVFVSVLEMKWQENNLLESFSNWMNSVLEREIPSEKVKKFVYNVYAALDENPDLNIETAIESVDEGAPDDSTETAENGVEEDTTESKNTDIEEVNMYGQILGINDLEEVGGINNSDYTNIQEVFKLDRNEIHWTWKIRDLTNSKYIKISAVFLCVVSITALFAGTFYWLGRNSVYIDRLQDIQVIERVREVAAEDGIVDKKLDMRATAYDLSYESCKKDRDHPEYGITYSGRKAVFGRTVAVDPETIPLDSELYIVFPDEYSHLNGIYVAEDIGSAVKDDIIDIFFGEDKAGEDIIAQKVRKFGVRNVEVYVFK